MKSFPTLFVGFLLLSASQVAVGQIVHLPHLSCATPHSITIAWTSSDSTDSKVLYRKGVAPFRSQPSSQTTRHHTEQLTDLDASTAYSYRVISGEDTSAEYTFTTAPKKKIPFVFVAYGDTRSNRAAHVTALRGIALQHPSFVLNTGDLVAKDSIALWDNYFTDVCSVTTVGPTISIYSSPGNHDKGSLYYANVIMPRNNPDKTPAYYSFDYSNVHLISLNSEIPFDSASAQFRWLLSDLASKAARGADFKIAFWHRPPYSSSQHGSALKIRSVLSPVMEAYNVDLVFNGHDHTYERTKPINGTTYIVTGGGGAPLYDFKTTNDWTAYKEKTYHFCRIAVDGKTLHLSMITPAGEERDTFTITK